VTIATKRKVLNYERTRDYVYLFSINASHHLLLGRVDSIHHRLLGPVRPSHQRLLGLVSRQACSLDSVKVTDDVFFWMELSRRLCVKSCSRVYQSVVYIYKLVMQGGIYTGSMMSVRIRWAVRASL